MMPQSPSKLSRWDLTQFSQLPLYFLESYPGSELSSLSKVILVWGKARSHRAPNLGCKGAESPGWFDVLPKNSAGDVMHERAHYHDEAANHQLPVVAAFWITQFARGTFKLNAKFDADLLLYLLIHFECDGHTVCLLTQWHLIHWLVQWSHHRSHMHIPVHSCCQVTSTS